MSTSSFINAEELRVSKQLQQKNKNSKYLSETGQECALCCKGMGQLTEGMNVWYINLTTDDMIAPIESNIELGDNDQGWFALGSECAKRVPLTHRMKF
jgi:hypothetical protein